MLPVSVHHLQAEQPGSGGARRRWATDPVTVRDCHEVARSTPMNPPNIVTVAHVDHVRHKPDGSASPALVGVPVEPPVPLVPTNPVIIQASAVPIAALPAVPAAVTQFRDEPADVLSLGEQFRPEQSVERLGLRNVSVRILASTSSGKAPCIRTLTVFTLRATLSPARCAGSRPFRRSPGPVHAPPDSVHRHASAVTRRRRLPPASRPPRRTGLIRPRE
jgi:hypothetical protein